MKTLRNLQNELCSGEYDSRLAKIYGCELCLAHEKRERLLSLLARYETTFGVADCVGLFSGPGRTELGGNHTDHQHGHILAAAVELDTVACAGCSGSNEVHIISEGYPDLILSAAEHDPIPAEEGTSAALVRGILARIAEMGFAVAGFHAVVDSNVLGGSGLSSSAAYEVLIGVIVNHLFCADSLTMIQIAQIGQYAENVYFGKPCGLMDQLTSAVGGVVSIDFGDPASPVVTKLALSPESYGYALCIIDSGADHADLTEEYAAIPHEMGQVARYFGKSVLREVDEHTFWQAIPVLRATAGDRAVLRAIHYFTDNRFAEEEAAALHTGDFRSFLSLVRCSGLSSALNLQNLSCSKYPKEQGIPVALATAEHLLNGKGAVRIHGGGFAGTVQAYVPLEEMDSFRAGMEAVLGAGCCHFLHLRPTGGVVLS